MHWRHATLLAAVSVAASHATATMTSSISTTGSGSAAASALPPRAPGQAHNLTGWQLDTCLHSPRSVKALALATYTDPNFFLGDDDTIVMLTPDNATAVTAHADHPRTEFRETGVADWELDSGEHVLSLLTAVLRVSNTNNETIIAQIHGSVNEEIAKVIKLRCEKRIFCALFMLKMIILPRQARDKQRENFFKGDAFFAGGRTGSSRRGSRTTQRRTTSSAWTAAHTLWGPFCRLRCASRQGCCRWW